MSFRVYDTPGEVDNASDSIPDSVDIRSSAVIVQIRDLGVFISYCREGDLH